MSNHIAAKFLGFVYSPIPEKTFTKLIPKLADSLRAHLPRYEEHSISGITVNVTGDTVAAQQEAQGLELHMVDAEGLWGIKIGNNGLSLSSSKYVAYEEMIPYFKSIMEIITEVLNITHFSRVKLRNINLFAETAGKPNSFENIREKEYWGRQEFDALEGAYLCNGASTRHEYFSKNYLQHIQLASGVVMGGQSYIPQDEWDIWRLRGEIPVEKEVKLLVDISGTSFQAPVNSPEKQNNVTEYQWTLVEECLNNLHDIVNRVYSDITKD